MTFIIFVIISIIVFIKLSDMKAEISAQKKLILRLRDQISKLERDTTNITKELEKLTTISPTQDVEAEEQLQEQEIEHEAVVAFKSRDDNITTTHSKPPKHVKKKKQPIDFSTTLAKKKPEFKFNNENWVGVTLLNRIGALLIVVAAILFAATTNFEILPPWLRSAILFAVAFLVIGLGEFMNRKKPTIASMGVSAAGVALLYVSIATSYFGLATLGMYSALIACILATAISVYLAIRYDEQVIGCFALVGGYLPIFALDPFNHTLTIGLIVYFILLSAISLILALSKKWSILNMIGLALTILGTSYLGWQAQPLTALLYACFAFLLYTALPLISAYRTDKTFHQIDIILIIINAFTSSIIVFLIANRLDIQYIHAYLSFIFAIIYFLLAKLIKQLFQQQNMETIFVLKSIAFAILFVPFTFDQHWFAVAWLIEAVVLTSYGILRKQKFAEYSGLTILGIAVISFLTNTVTLGSQFTLDYTFFSIGLLIILGLYIKEKRQWNGYEQIFKWFTLGNFWTFLMYIFFLYIYGVVSNGYSAALLIVATLILAWIYVKIKIIADNGTYIIANIMHFVSVIMLWSSNFSYITTWNPESNFLVFILNIALTFISLAMVLYYKEVEQKNRWVASYKNILLVNVWLSVLWFLSEPIQMVEQISTDYIAIAFSIATLILVAIYVRTKLLVDRHLIIIVNIMHAACLSMLWFSNFIFAFWSRYMHHGGSVNYGGLVANLIITLIAFAMVIYYQKSATNTNWVVIYKNINLVNIWLSILFIFGIFMEGFVANQMVLIIITLLLAMAIVRIKMIYDEGVKVISLVMKVVGLLWLLAFNLSVYEYMLALLLLNVVAQIIALVALHELIKLLRNKDGKDSPFKLLILLGYFLLVVTQGVMVQGQVAFTSVIISVLFGVTALAWIIIGFQLKDKPVRKFGLYLAIVSVAKLVIVDTWGWGLSMPMRIGSYVILGIVLMIISFVYQKFSIELDDR